MGGGGQDEDLLVPPPQHPLPPRGGEISGRKSLTNYGLVINRQPEQKKVPCFGKRFSIKNAGLSDFLAVILKRNPSRGKNIEAKPT